MAAAVSDFTVACNARKLRRNAAHSLALEPTMDILSGVAKSKRSGQYIAGFCMADHDQIHHVAVEKLETKSLDLIIGNSPEVFGKAMRQVCCYKKNCSTPIWSGTFSVEEIAYRILQSMYENETAGLF
jgi:phosphopantothenoylcysteine synthetase/decarboxylase